MTQNSYAAKTGVKSKGAFLGDHWLCYEFEPLYVLFQITLLSSCLTPGQFENAAIHGLE